MRSDSWLVDQLPVGMLDSPLFVRFVEVFQAVGGTILEATDSSAYALDVAVAPAPLLPWLGSWIGVTGLDAGTAVPRQRAVLRASAHMLAWRGTLRGLREYAALLSDGPVEVTDNGGVYAEGPVRSSAGSGWVPPDEVEDEPPRVTVSVRSTGGMGLDEFVGLLLEEVPAHVAVRLLVAGETVWATGTGTAPRVEEVA